MTQKIHSRNVQMKLLKNRLATFDGFDKLFAVDVGDLAGSGFYYTGKDDRVICAFCSREVEDWKQNDMPLLDHRRLSSNCYFIQKKYEEYSKEKYKTDNTYEINFRICTSDAGCCTTYQDITIEISQQSGHLTHNISVSFNKKYTYIPST